MEGLKYKYGQIEVLAEEFSNIASMHMFMAWGKQETIPATICSGLQLAIPINQYLCAIPLFPPIILPILQTGSYCCI